MAINGQAVTLYDLNDVGASVRNPTAGTGLRFSASTRKWEAEDVDLLTKYDEDSTDPNVSYLGKAVPGTLITDALWQIQRITVSGDVTSIEYADGNTYFDNIWNNRKTLSYS